MGSLLRKERSSSITVVKKKASPTSTTQCRSTGACISRYFLCDGRNHCHDGSDEECNSDSNGNSKCPKG